MHINLTSIQDSIKLPKLINQHKKIIMRAVFQEMMLQSIVQNVLFSLEKPYTVLHGLWFECRESGNGRCRLFIIRFRLDKVFTSSKLFWPFSFTTSASIVVLLFLFGN